MKHPFSLIVALALCGQAALADPGARPDYLDNRSTPADLVRSFYNALDLRQYARAYTYLRADSVPIPFDSFKEGYAQTATVSVTTGAVTSDGAAGSIYSTVPVVVRAQLQDGTPQVFGGCYLVRQIEPGIQDPPVTPMQILKGHLVARDSATNAMPVACSDQGEPSF